MRALENAIKRFNQQGSRPKEVLPDGSKAMWLCPACLTCMFGKVNVVAEGCGHVVCKNCVAQIKLNGTSRCPKCEKGDFKYELPFFVEEPSYMVPNEAEELV